MSTNFPTSVDSYSVKVDNVDDVVASHVNNLQDAVVAIETDILDKRPENNFIIDTMMYEHSYPEVQSSNVLDAYWNFSFPVGQGSNLTVSRQAGDSSDPFNYYTKVLTAGNQQFGIVKFLTNAEVVKLRGKDVSFSVDLWATGITAMRMSVLQWSSTADSITRDVVGTWAAGNPTLATNWSYLYTPSADVTISGTRARYKIENIAVGSSANNLAVFVWTPNSESTNDFFNIVRPKLEIGNIATDFVGRNAEAEKLLLDSQYQKSYVPTTTVPTQTVTGLVHNYNIVAIAASTAGLIRNGGVIFRPTMIKTPTVTIYAFTNETNSITNTSTGTVRGGTTATDISRRGFGYLSVDNSDADPIAAGASYAYHWVADGRL